MELAVTYYFNHLFQCVVETNFQNLSFIDQMDLNMHFASYLLDLKCAGTVNAFQHHWILDMKRKGKKNLKQINK